MNKSRAAVAVIVAALALLASSAAQATVFFNAYLSSSSNTYTVMGVDSTLIIRITNQASSTEAMNNVILDFSANNADVINVAGGNWIWTVDLANRSKVTITAPSCIASDLIQPGSYLEFVVHIMPKSLAADLTDTFDGVSTNSKAGPAGCRPVKTTNAGAPLPSWSLKGLEAPVAAAPSSVITGGTITVTMTVTNRSSATQNALAPSMSVVSSGGGACTLSSPSPASLSLASGASGQFGYTCVATSAQGTVAFRGSAGNGAVSSASYDSQPVAIGNLTSSLAVSPTGTTSGSTVTVTMQVTNGGSTTITNIVPTGACAGPGYLCTLGTATATYASGPTPASRAELLPGNTVSFTWTYTVTGTVGQTYYFNGYATADGPVQTNTATSNTGSISSITVTSSPSGTLRNSTNQTFTWTVTNTGSVGIDRVTITNPSTTIFQTPGSASVTCNSCTWTRTTTATTVLWSNGTAACHIKDGVSCDFPWTFGQVGNATTPASTTDYSFRTDLRDTVPITTTKYTNVQVAVPPPTPPGDVTVSTATSNNASVMLYWTNPSSRHDGVVILRTGIAGTCAVPDTKPTDGTEYFAGNTVGNATVIYSDKNSSLVSTYQNTGLTNGWQYCYKIFNHDSSFIYSPGTAQPNGIKGFPTSGVEPSPLWSYSIGAATAMTPTTYANVGIYTSSNLGYVSGLSVTNGGEQWRPVDVGGVVQGKMTVVNLTTGGNPRYIFTGAANGYVYAIRASDGTVAWSYNVGNPILAPPSVHLRTNATALFKAKYANDLVYFVTRDSSTRTANKVVAFDALNGGAPLWTFSGGGLGLDMVNAALGLNFLNDKLFVASYSGAVAGSQPSFWVLDLLNDGALLASKSLGDIDASPTFSGTQRAYVSVPARSGIVYSYNTSDYTERWPGGFDTGSGASNSFNSLQRTGDGFMLTSGSAGKVWRITDNGASASLFPGWATNPITGVTGVSQALVLSPNDVFFVGSTDGKLYQRVLSSGASQFYKTLGAAGTAIGSPAGDSSAGGYQIVVGTGGGVVYKFTMPFTGNF